MRIIQGNISQATKECGDADAVDKTGRSQAGSAATRERRHAPRSNGDGAHEVVGAVCDVHIGAGTVCSNTKRRGKTRNGHVAVDIPTNDAGDTKSHHF